MEGFTPQTFSGDFWTQLLNTQQQWFNHHNDLEKSYIIVTFSFAPYNSARRTTSKKNMAQLRPVLLQKTRGKYIPSSTWQASESASIQMVNQHLTPAKKSSSCQYCILSFAPQITERNCWWITDLNWLLSFRWRWDKRFSLQTKDILCHFLNQWNLRFGNSRFDLPNIENSRFGLNYNSSIKTLKFKIWKFKIWLVKYWKFKIWNSKYWKFEIWKSKYWKSKIWKFKTLTARIAKHSILGLPNFENSRFGNSKFGDLRFGNSRLANSKFSLPNILEIQDLEIQDLKIYGLEFWIVLHEDPFRNIDKRRYRRRPIDSLAWSEIKHWNHIFWSEKGSREGFSLKISGSQPPFKGIWTNLSSVLTLFFLFTFRWAFTKVFIYVTFHLWSHWHSCSLTHFSEKQHN